MWERHGRKRPTGKGLKKQKRRTLTLDTPTPQKTQRLLVDEKLMMRLERSLAGNALEWLQEEAEMVQLAEVSFNREISHMLPKNLILNTWYSRSDIIHVMAQSHTAHWFQ